MTDIRDSILDDIRRGFTPRDKTEQRRAIGSAVYKLIRVMDDPKWRERLVARVQAEMLQDPAEPVWFFKDLRDPDLEHAALWWPTIRRSIPSDDEALHGMSMNFSKCIRTGKAPSGKIIAFVKAYTRDWRATHYAEEHGVLDAMDDDE